MPLSKRFRFLLAFTIIVLAVTLLHVLIGNTQKPVSKEPVTVRSKFVCFSLQRPGKEPFDDVVEVLGNNYSRAHYCLLSNVCVKWNKVADQHSFSIKYMLDTYLYDDSLAGKKFDFPRHSQDTGQTIVLSEQEGAEWFHVAKNTRGQYWQEYEPVSPDGKFIMAREKTNYYRGLHVLSRPSHCCMNFHVAVEAMPLLQESLNDLEDTYRGWWYPFGGQRKKMKRIEQAFAGEPQIVESEGYLMLRDHEEEEGTNPLFYSPQSFSNPSETETKEIIAAASANHHSRSPNFDPRKIQSNWFVNQITETGNESILTYRAAFHRGGDLPFRFRKNRLPTKNRDWKLKERREEEFLERNNFQPSPFRLSRTLSPGTSEMLNKSGDGLSGNWYVSRVGHVGWKKAFMRVFLPDDKSRRKKNLDDPVCFEHAIMTPHFDAGITIRELRRNMYQDMETDLGKLSSTHPLKAWLKEYGRQGAGEKENKLLLFIHRIETRSISQPDLLLDALKTMVRHFNVEIVSADFAGQTVLSRAAQVRAADIIVGLCDPDILYFARPEVAAVAIYHPSYLYEASGHNGAIARLQIHHTHWDCSAEDCTWQEKDIDALQFLITDAIMHVGGTLKSIDDTTFMEISANAI